MFRNIMRAAPAPRRTVRAARGRFACMSAGAQSYDRPITGIIMTLPVWSVTERYSLQPAGSQCYTQLSIQRPTGHELSQNPQ